MTTWTIRVRWTVERVIEVDGETPADAIETAATSDALSLAEAIEVGEVSAPQFDVMPPRERV